MNLFSGQHKGLDFEICQDLTIQSMNTYGPKHDTWCLAWSGGKDSTATVTYIIYLLKTNRLKWPKRLIVVLADTRLELPPLWASAMLLKKQIENLGINVEIVMAPLEKRFMTYMLGRGVPPPNNQTLRWCTGQIKVKPMKEFVDAHFKANRGKLLMITGVRVGESAVRDKRIVMSCSRGDGECGQGWYQNELQSDNCATLAPLLHWKLCHVWDWLKYLAPLKRFGSWQTALLSKAYGHDEKNENDARTGCMGCPLASKDSALDNLIKVFPEYEYLKPLKELRPLYRWLRLPQNRLRKIGLQINKDGGLAKNQNRMGPLTIKAREIAFDKIKDIELRVNSNAKLLPKVDLINQEEEKYIRQCWANNLLPNKWTGEEPTADLPFVQYFKDGSFQQKLF